MSKPFVYCIYQKIYWTPIRSGSEYPMLKSGEFKYNSDEIQTFDTEAEAKFVMSSLEKDNCEYEVRPCKQ